MSIAEDVNIEELAIRTTNYSGAEINMICREAGMICLDENIDNTHITKNHIQLAMKMVKPVISEDMLHAFESFHNK